MSGRSLFVTFEGGEGSGKSTQARALCARLCREGWPVVLTCEPGGTRLGEQIRALLLGEAGRSLAPRAELLLFAAARAQLVAEVVAAAQARGEIVVCDRFAESSLAYQGAGRGLPAAIIRAASAIATDGCQADLVVLLDLPAARGLGRKSMVDWNRFEREEIAFHERVRAAYLDLAAAEPERWLVVDATLPADEVARRVWERVRPLIPSAPRTAPAQTPRCRSDP